MQGDADVNQRSSVLDRWQNEKCSNAGDPCQRDRRLRRRGILTRDKARIDKVTEWRSGNLFERLNQEIAVARF